MFVLYHQFHLNYSSFLTIFSQSIRNEYVILKLFPTFVACLTSESTQPFSIIFFIGFSHYTLPGKPNMASWPSSITFYYSEAETGNNFSLNCSLYRRFVCRLHSNYFKLYEFFCYGVLYLMKCKGRFCDCVLCDIYRVISSAITGLCLPVKCLGL
jgi:hypothetical protein